tara:strand:+ start:2059 stop:2328 length:270 start_codon:yes stop_codon:yes gene_type:complete
LLTFSKLIFSKLPVNNIEKRPIKKPKNIAIPPILTIGILCTFLLSGISDKLNLAPNDLTKGTVKNVDRKLTRVVVIKIRLMFKILIFDG